MDSHQFLSQRELSDSIVPMNYRFTNGQIEFFKEILGSVDMKALRKIIEIGTYGLSSDRVEENTECLIQNIDRSL